MNITAPEILNAAADLIEKNGHTKGQYWDPDGCLCSLGAISRATTQALAANGYDYLGDVALHAKDALALYIDPAGVESEQGNFSIITEWNDHPERTLDQVVAAFREAAKAAS